MSSADPHVQDLERARSVFVSSVSHEIRTPLTSILGYIELLTEDAHTLSDAQQEMLQIIERNSHRLLELIEDILILSRIESGSFRVLKDPVDIEAVVRSACAEVWPQAHLSSSEIQVDISTDIGSVLGDADELKRSLVQLLSNAVKFSRQGDDVEVHAYRDGGGVILQVSDSGMGIKEHDLPEVFKPFFRSEDALARAIPGTGLGLAIASTIVELHGGKLTCESEVGKGTTMTMLLPFAMATRKVS